MTWIVAAYWSKSKAELKFQHRLAINKLAEGEEAKEEANGRCVMCHCNFSNDRFNHLIYEVLYRTCFLFH